MADKRRIESNLLLDMRNVRATNNDLWMLLVKIALESEPERTKNLIKQIQANDSKIVDLWKEIADAPV